MVYEIRTFELEVGKHQDTGEWRIVQVLHKERLHEDFKPDRWQLTVLVEHR